MSCTGRSRIGQQAQQPLRVVQQQVRPLVGREAARKAQRQRVGIEQMLRTVDRLGRRAGRGQLPGQSLAGVFDQRAAGGGAKLPEPGVGDAANVLLQGFRRPQPAILAAGLRPQIVGRRRVPGRHVDAVGHVSDRHLVRRPARKERRKEMPAHLSVQAAHAIDRPASADRQIGHVEVLRRVVRVLAAQRQQIVERDAELLPGVAAEAVLDQGRSETVEAGGHRRVRGEEIARARDGQRDLEGLPGRLHETPRAFQHGERRMPFIQVADLRLDAERGAATAIRRSPAPAPA